MGLSSNILWHQTTKDGLIKIIKSSCFKYSYSTEAIFKGTKDTDSSALGIPMISFSDLPFSELENYIGKYGNYIIGINSDWGKKNGFSPVWYCYESSNILKYILNNIISENQELEDESNSPFIEILKYIKFVEGPLKEHKYSKYRFMDEREVRFCPESHELVEKKYKTILTFKQYQEYKKEHGNSLLDLGVKFEINDIKYIIVKNDGNIDEFDKLLKSKSINHKVHIFSENQIKEDFIGLNHDIKISTDEYKSSDANTTSQIELLMNPAKLLIEIVKQMEKGKVL